MIKKFFSSTKEKNRAESEKLMQNIEIQIRSKLDEIEYVKERSCSTDPNVRRDSLDDLKFLEEEHEMLLEEYYELKGTISLSRHKNSQVREIKRENINLKKQKQKLEWQLKRLEDKLYYFEDKAGRKKWVNDLRDRVLLVEKWKYDIITKKSSLCNKEIDLLTDLKLAEASEEKKLILEGIIS